MTLLTLLLHLAPPALAADPTAELYQESYALETAANYTRALARLEGIEAVGADAYTLPLRRGWLLYLLGRYDESIVAYRQAIAAEPEAIEARLGLTLPLLAQRQWRAVEGECRAALAVAPGNYLAQSRLAYALYSSGRYQEAEQAYAALVELYPADVDMRSGLGWAQLKQGKTQAARESFEAVLHIAPDHASAREGLGGV